MKFADLKFEQHPNWDEVAARHDFKNGYGVSVIKAKGSYGYEQGLHEIAVFKDGDLCYDTHITDDVLGSQTEDQITEVMRQVEALPTD